jgi:glutamate-ammonia-ligase adenylyltransferase
MSDLPEALKTDFAEKWDAFCEAARLAQIEIPMDKHFSEALSRVFAFSDFVAKSCIREPEILFNLLEKGDFKKCYPENTVLKKLQGALDGLTDIEKLVGTLRRIRRYEMVRIAWRDLAGWADLAETVTDLSNLADACIELALSILYKQLCRELGTPTRGDGSAQNLVVIGMGKLGGRELNFSSDVDLVFAYAEDGVTGGGPAKISNDEFFSRLARRLIGVIGKSTSDGFVFRTDMRLRPYGDSGPIVMNFDAMEAYYQWQGREWERYAWIKARVVAGDKPAGKELMERLKPFVYRRYLDYGAFESLRLMKRKISIETQRKGIENNIKLGPGGIREVEFFGQVFQLIRGGVEPSLQESRILKVIKVLVNKNYISADAGNGLDNAYVFLRKTENRLQEFSDQQTHALPQDTVGRKRLAAAMGFKDWGSFDAVLEDHMTCVHFHFDRLLEAKESERPDEEFEQNLEGIWQGIIDEDQSRNVLLNAGFERPDDVLGILTHLKHDSATRALSNEGRERLDKLIPLILRDVGRSEKPHSNLSQIIDLVKTIERRTCYLALLTENPSALTRLVKLAGASSWIVSFLTRHPVLLDELLDPRDLYIPPEKSEIEKELRKKLARIPAEELEQQIEELCIFKQINTLRVAAADVTGVLPLMRVSDHLSEIAETVLSEVVELSWQHLTRRHGVPRCTLNGDTCERGFSVVAYGKLGGIELGYDSDLDLVFLHAGTDDKTQGGGHPIENAQFFARLGQRVVHLLTAHTPAGFLYEADMRLRPSGSAGLLVCHVEAFREYQIEKAWIWEHQALLRARAVCGDDRLAHRFNRIRKEVLARPRSRKKLQEAVTTMRERLRRESLDANRRRFDIKQSPGGIVDIEFLVQFLVLFKSYKFPELLRWTDNVRLLDTLSEAKILNAQNANALKEAYLTYRGEVHRLSLQEKPASISPDTYAHLRKEVLNIWDRIMNT